MDQPTATLIAAGTTFLVGMTAALTALMIGWRQGTASRFSAEAAKSSAEAATLTARASGDREIAKMRLEWLRDLRNLLAEYHSTLLDYKDADYRKAAELGTHLDLMLNQQEPVQKELWDVADEIFHNPDKRTELDKRLVEAGRAVLKNEWNKIKDELRARSQ
jgi:hypothetical protein